MTAIAIPRSAATLLLLRDDPLEVLMVRRASGGSFASALVFPGGTVDADDASEAWLPLVTGAEGLEAGERALRIAALRESFEEAGLFMAIDGDGQGLPPPDGLEHAFRKQIAAGRGKLPLAALVHFAQWVTPEALPKRWDTHFFLARAPMAQAPICDGREIVAAGWYRPAEVIEQEEFLPAPTRMNLTRLAQSADVASALAAARARPPFTVLPVLHQGADGAVTRIPIEAGYGETEIPHRPR